MSNVRPQSRNPNLPEMLILKRLSVVLLAYSLSSPGILAIIAVLSSGEMAGSQARIPIAASLIVAWLAHAAMSLAWALNHRLHKVWPVVGTYAAVLALIAVPASVFIDRGSFDVLAATASGSLTLLGLVAVSPCVFLAVHLFGYHTQSRAVSG